MNSEIRVLEINFGADLSVTVKPDIPISAKIMGIYRMACGVYWNEEARVLYTAPTPNSSLPLSPMERYKKILSAVRERLKNWS